MDVVDRATRSRLMAGIKSGDTEPEMTVRRYLHASGFRFRLHDKRLPGRPDLVLPKWRVTILIHGCFWHAHRGCRYFKLPETRREFWHAKLSGNVKRDTETLRRLEDTGWRRAVIWECALRRDADATLEALAQWIREESDSLELPEVPYPRELD